jgi:hypothetical protein
MQFSKFQKHIRDKLIVTNVEARYAYPPAPSKSFDPTSIFLLITGDECRRNEKSLHRLAQRREMSGKRRGVRLVLTTVPVVSMSAILNHLFLSFQRYPAY